LEEINDQLQEKGLLMRTGTIVDASITETPNNPKGKAQYEVLPDNETENKAEEETAEPSSTT
jgi:IS5 family transposase